MYMQFYGDRCMKRLMLVLMFLFLSSVIVTAEVEIGPAYIELNPKSTVPLLIGNLEGSSEAAYSSANAAIIAKCVKFPESAEASFNSCNAGCVGKWQSWNPEGACEKNCMFNFGKDKFDIWKPIYKEYLVLSKSYNEQILSKTLPSGVLQKALQEHGAIFADHTSCVDTFTDFSYMMGNGNNCRNARGRTRCEDSFYQALNAFVDKYAKLQKEPYCSAHPDCVSQVIDKVGDKAVDKEPIVREEEKPAKKDLQEERQTAFLDKWDEWLTSEAGANNVATRGLKECKAAIAAQVKSCKKRNSKGNGWMVDNIMSIDRPLGNSEFQHVKAEGGCLQGDAKRVTIDTKNFDSGSGDYQVICAVNCYTWTCEKDSIKVFKGKVEIQREGTLKKLSEDTEIKEGDVIKTGSRGIVRVELDNVLMKIGPDSIVEVEAMDSIYLKAGKMWAWVGHILEENQMKVKTPGAVQAIRGTEFILKYDETQGTTTLHLRSGEIEVTSSSGEVRNVFPGQTTVTNKEGTIEKTALTNMSDKEWNSLVDKEIHESDSKANKRTKMIGGLILLFMMIGFIGAIIWSIVYIVRKVKKK